MNKSKVVLNLFNEQDKTSILNGKSKQSAKNVIYNLVDKFTKGIYSDQYWIPYKDILKVLADNGIDYEIQSTKYDNNMPPTSKTWYIDISFKDNKGKDVVLNAYIKAHGAGSVSEPLDKYDLTFIFMN